MAYKPAIKMVPRPLWDQNLRRAIPASRWTKVRRSLIAERGLNCQTCGKAEAESKRLQAHEDWEYETTCTPAIAHLRRLVLSCWHCHAVEHFGRTHNMVRTGQLSAQGLEDTINHFCRLNQVGRAEFEAHVAEAAAEWARLSELEWSVDWGEFADLVSTYRER